MPVYSIRTLKYVLDGLVSGRLKDLKSKYALKYESSKELFLFEVIIRKRQTKIIINLSSVIKFLEDDALSKTLCLYYCALYILEYVKAIESSYNGIPMNYCEGVAQINAMYISGYQKRAKVFAPLMFCRRLSTVYPFRTMDIICEANALLKLKYLFHGKISEEESDTLQCEIDKGLLFVEVPEAIRMSKNRLRLTVSEVLTELKHLRPADLNVSTYWKEWIKVAAFGDKELIAFLLKQIKTDNNEFAMGVLIRILIFDGQILDGLYDKDEIKQILFYLSKYREKLADYLVQQNQYVTAFLEDNRKNISKTVIELNKMADRLTSVLANKAVFVIQN